MDWTTQFTPGSKGTTGKDGKHVPRPEIVHGPTGVNKGHKNAASPAPKTAKGKKKD